MTPDDTNPRTFARLLTCASPEARFPPSHEVTRDLTSKQRAEARDLLFISHDARLSDHFLVPSSAPATPDQHHLLAQEVTRHVQPLPPNVSRVATPARPRVQTGYIRR